MTAGTEDLDVQTVVLNGRATSAELVGGKAAMLDRLIALGAPVPSSGAVTTTAYRRVVGGSPALRALLDELITGPLPALPDREQARRTIDEAFLAAPMPTDLADAIVGLARQVGHGGPVAVRSSATAEDLQRASFAGQYRTLLSVEPGDVCRAVRLCWASLWHPTPRGYRRFRRIDETDLAMAVLIMPMLAPSQAGVLFTEDPGRSEAIRIELVEGLGEALVSGARTPDAVVVERRALDTFDPDPPGLRELAETSLRLEEEIGVPLDIEWAIEDGTVILLQARPITTTPGPAALDDGFDVVSGHEVRSTTAGIAEMLPGALTPRVWTANSWLLEEAFRGLFDNLAADLGGLEGAHAVLGRFRGRAALNLDLMEQIVESVPGGSSAELEHQYFGDALEPSAAPTRPPAGSTRLVQTGRVLRGRARAFRESELTIQAVANVLDAEPPLSDLNDFALLAFRRRLLHLAARAMEAELSIAATAAASYRGLEIFLRQHLDQADATTALQRLTSPDRVNHRGLRALSLNGLADRLRDDDDLAEARAADSWPEARARLEATKAGLEFLADFERALRRAGSASIFGGSTWDTVPGLVWPMLVRERPRSASRSRLRADMLTDVEQQIADDRRWRSTRALTGQLVDVRRPFLRREATDAAVFLDRREQTKASLLMLGGILWRVDRELGRRLTAAGWLEEIDDIDLLTGDESARLVDDRPPAPELLAFRRRCRTAAELEAPLPRLFYGRPAAPTPPPVGGSRVKGWSGSPGRYEGRACVVRRPERSGLRRGEVLVAHTTDSSWLPLFQIAGAVVVEEGGPLSHAAVLARELGMPAVVNLPGIVNEVAHVPGALLVVDGSTGEVGIHQLERHEPVIGVESGDREDHEVEPTDGIVPARPEPIVGTGDPNRLQVFITGLIGTGALMSVVIGLAQAIGSARTQRRVSLQVRPRAEALAAAVVHGFEPRAVGCAGIRPRGYYAWTAVVGAGLSVLLLWAGDDYVEEPSQAGSVWQLAAALTSASTVAAFAAVNLVAAKGWPRVPWVARLATAPRVHQRLTPNQLVGPVHATFIGALLLTVLGLGWLVDEADRPLLIVDEWLFNAIGAGTDDRWSPTVLDQILRREVMVPLAVMLTAATYRCRALLLTYPLVIAGGGALHLGLAHFISRERPPDGPKPGFTDSFPGGHVNELTIMLGLLPLILFVLTRRRWVGVVVGAVCWPTLLVLLADAFRTGDHWPTDNLAGLFIGLSMVLIAHGVSRAPALHGRCRGCPTRLEAGAEAPVPVGVNPGPGTRRR